MDSLLTRARVTAAIALVASLGISHRAHAQLIAPGKLSSPHAHLEGVKNCFECHETGTSTVSNTNCRACHESVDARIRRGRGYHGHLPPQKLACGECHREHLGRNGRLIHWPGAGKKRFNHDATGYPLRGQHAKVECNDCHDTRLIVDRKVKARLKRYPNKETHLGLGRACADCHFDEHRGQEGRRCEKCHTEQEWKPPTNFNHNRDSKYPLTGKHRQVNCSECHKTLRDTKTPPTAFPAPRSRHYAKLVGIPFGSCTDCHSDPHNGEFGEDCASCHTTRGWGAMKGSSTTIAPGFHDDFAYPLEGLHEKVPCRECHGPWGGQAIKYKGLSFERCTSCHYDAHLGQLEISAGESGRDCAECHTVAGYLPPGYERETHANARYPLEGAHAAVPCNECHLPDRALTKRISTKLKRRIKRETRSPQFCTTAFDLERSGTGCEECHRDVHRGQFASSKPEKACADCHVVESFTSLPNFDHNRDTKFALVGHHANVACFQCHGSGEEGHYRGLEASCSSCHFDTHLGQFEKTFAPDQSTHPSCEQCHSPEGFSPATFDHNDRELSDYPLDGAHRDVSCDRCHPTVGVNAGTKSYEVVRYRPLPRVCEGCHSDYHRGALGELE